ncbi:hypothetical protein BM221_008594 [Beauveria bassiana]|uniref:Uncharacterized protein n=1 Tax=Beauveria bassiana TaxID=176275 RepID=A0A2N6ND92_BEABA|nr:hypothetical protein BM221_008594 [Beauveria bassiana]
MAEIGLQSSANWRASESPQVQRVMLDVTCKPIRVRNVMAGWVQALRGYFGNEPKEDGLHVLLSTWKGLETTPQPDFVMFNL